VNAIGLTGTNMQAMADVAEQLLELTTAGGHAFAIFLYIENVAQANAIRRNHIGLTEIWRIGRDTTRPDLDRHRMVECTLDDSDPAQLRAEVELYLTRLVTLIEWCQAIPATLTTLPAPPAHHSLEISR
jgi:hypothetical protein